MTFENYIDMILNSGIEVLTQDVDKRDLRCNMGFKRVLSVYEDIPERLKSARIIEPRDYKNIQKDSIYRLSDEVIYQGVDLPNSIFNVHLEHFKHEDTADLSTSLFYIIDYDGIFYFGNVGSFQTVYDRNSEGHDRLRFGFVPIGMNVLYLKMETDKVKGVYIVRSASYRKFASSLKVYEKLKNNLSDLQTFEQSNVEDLL